MAMDWPAERIFNERAERLNAYREQVKRLEADLEMQRSLTATAQDGMRQLGEDLARCRERCANMKTLEGLSIDELNARLMAAQAELESDRTKCADFVIALDKALGSRFWLTEGRGSYSWDDDRYRQEFKEAAEEILQVVMPMRSMAANKAQCPQTTAEVVKARVDLKERVSKLERENAALLEGYRHDDLLLRSPCLELFPREEEGK